MQRNEEHLRQGNPEAEVEVKSGARSGGVGFDRQQHLDRRTLSGSHEGCS